MFANQHRNTNASDRNRKPKSVGAVVAFYRQFITIKVYVVIFIFIGLPFMDATLLAGMQRGSRFCSVTLERHTAVAQTVSLFEQFLAIAELPSCSSSSPSQCFRFTIPKKGKRNTRHTKKEIPIAEFGHYD